MQTSFINGNNNLKAVLTAKDHPVSESTVSTAVLTYANIIEMQDRDQNLTGIKVLEPSFLRLISKN